MDWKTLLSYITGTVDQELLLRNEYLVTENRILRNQMQGRVRLSDDERKTLAAIGKRLGRKALEEVASIVKPDTILGWHRTLVAQKFDGSQQRTRGMITSSHQDLVRALPGDKGNMSQSLQTLEARGLMVIGRSPGGKAESLWLTPEGQKWAAQLAGSCDEGETDVAAMGYRACNSLYVAPAPLSAGGSSKMAEQGAECEV
jgi:DNA-binding MarR family transcriptional regulator